MKSKWMERNREQRVTCSICLNWYIAPNTPTLEHGFMFPVSASKAIIVGSYSDLEAGISNKWMNQF